MDSQEVWFSHRERIYRIDKGRIEWTDEKKIWTWDHCTVSCVKPPLFQEGSSPKKLRVVVRSNSNQNQTSIKVNRPMTLRYMLGFDIEKVGEVHMERPALDLQKSRDSESWTGSQERLAFQLDEDYWIWMWKDDAKSSYVHDIHDAIVDQLSEANPDRSKQIFELEPKSPSDQMVMNQLTSSDWAAKGRIVPVIYQPAVDSLKNFVREVHCAQKDYDDGRSEVEVTLIFNDEQLRNNSIWNKIYRRLRSIIYNRTADVESFWIKIDRKDRSRNRFVFKNIYSVIDGQRHELNDDSIHGDAEDEVEHEISYYFVDYSHPIVFINTSNHAMAEHDANRTLWKWEYVPGVMDSPVSLGSKTRKEIDDRYNH